MTAPLVLCACGQPAAYVTHDERPLCDRCNPGLNAPHPQAVRLSYPDWLVARRRERLAALLAGGDLGEGPGLDVYDLNHLRWLNTLDAVTAERDVLRAAARAFFATCNHCASCGAVAVWYSRIYGEHYCDADACKPVPLEDRAKWELSRCLTDEERALLALLPPEAP